MTDTWRYQAFGETLARTGTSANPLGFVGQLGYYQEADLSLHYVRARWYDARTGRWVSEDPVEGGNLYGYVGNWATRGVDPSGRVRAQPRWPYWPYEIDAPPGWLPPPGRRDYYWPPRDDLDCLMAQSRCLKAATAAGSEISKEIIGVPAADDVLDEFIKALLEGALGPLIAGTYEVTQLCKKAAELRKLSRKVAAWRRWCDSCCKACMRLVEGAVRDCTDRRALDRRGKV